MARKQSYLGGKGLFHTKQMDAEGLSRELLLLTLLSPWRPSKRPLHAMVATHRMLILHALSSPFTSSAKWGQERGFCLTFSGLSPKMAVSNFTFYLELFTSRDLVCGSSRAFQLWMSLWDCFVWAGLEDPELRHRPSTWCSISSCNGGAQQDHALCPRQAALRCAQSSLCPSHPR